MADKYWLADVPTAYDTAAAWTGGAKPAAGDTAIFDGRHVGNVTAGAGAETITNLYVGSGYTGQMFTSVAKGTINCTGSLKYFGGGAQAWIISECPSVVVATRRYEANAFNLELSSTGFEFAAFLAGRINLAMIGGASVGQIMIGRDARGAEPVVTIASGTEIEGPVFIAAGELNASGAVFGSGAGLRMQGGVARLDTVPGTDLDVHQTGGLIQLSGNSAINVVNLHVLGGSFVASELAGKFTVAGSILVGDRGEVNVDNGQPIGAPVYGLVMPGGRFRAFADPATLLRL